MSVIYLDTVLNLFLAFIRNHLRSTFSGLLCYKLLVEVNTFFIMLSINFKRTEVHHVLDDHSCVDSSPAGELPHPCSLLVAA